MPARKPMTKPVPPPALELKLASTERGEATRARLIETAYTLFCRQGYHGTSLRDIAESAGVAVGGIYNHFKDKEELFAAVLDTYHPYHTLFPVLEGLEADTVEDYIRRAAYVLYDTVSGARAQLLPLIFIELVEFQGRHLRQLVGTIAPFALKMVTRMGQLKGRLRSVAPLQLLTSFLSLIIGMVMTDMLLKNLPLFKAMQAPGNLDSLIDIFLHGVLESE